MKLSLRGLLSLVFLSCSPLFGTHAEETSVWLAGDGIERSGTILLPDKKGAFDLEIKDATGITFGKKPDSGKDTKSLEFSGTQTAVFRSLLPFPPASGGLQINLQALIPEEAGDRDSSLLRHGTQWEIRYLAAKTAILFVIWHESNVFTEVSVPIPLGSWETISAEYTADKLTLIVNGQEKSVAPKDLLRQESAPAHLLLGASSTKIEDETMARIFTGSLADIRIQVQ
jgi:hypothetical protein